MLKATRTQSSKALTKAPVITNRPVVLRRSTADGEKGASEPSDGPRVWKEYGQTVVESDKPFKGPEDEKDFWEGDNFESFGAAATNFYPILLVLGVICGGIAAGTYNKDANVFLATPQGPEGNVRVVPADPDAITFATSDAPDLK